MSPKDRGEIAAESKVVSVTVYEDSALVTREVLVPEGKGQVDLLVTPLPSEVVGRSLYTEAEGGLRVLSTRYRTRAVKEDSRAAVRELDASLKELKHEQHALEEAKAVTAKNLALMEKLEGFASASLTQLTEKGRLDAEGTIELADQIMERREKITTEQVETTRHLEEIAESIGLAERKRAELAEGVSRTERDALVTVDRGEEGHGGSVKLSYLVENAHWEPQYRFRAGAEDEPVQMDYLAAIEQQTGEDWNEVEVTLSTSQPSLNAAPPPLLALDVDLVGMGGMGMGGGMMGGMGGMGMTTVPQDEAGLYSLKDVLEKSRSMRQQAQQEERSGEVERKGDLVNEAAALEQTGELLARGDEKAAKGGEEAQTDVGGAPSLLFRLEGTRTIPSRSDQQLVEVAQMALKADFYDRAVPVLTNHVYRLADLKNEGNSVILPGEARMYVGSDFVGRMELTSQIAVGEPFTLGFGTDPQVLIHRKLMEKEHTVQGGNQVWTYQYRIRANSYKDRPVKLQVWDRLPRADGEKIGISLEKTEPGLSENTTYLRRDRPANLLRWDVTLKPEDRLDDALTISYSFKLEFARGSTLQGLHTEPETLPPGAGGMMGGVGGGFR